VGGSTLDLQVLDDPFQPGDRFQVDDISVVVVAPGAERVAGTEALEETTERATGKREKLLATIEQELKLHTKIEEEIFYPAFRDAAKKKDDKDLYYEAIEEHHVVDVSAIARDVDGDVVAEFCNFALANSARRLRSNHA